ncbi:transglutaminase-like superfamily protein, partial [Chlamydia psittaci C1/97]
KRSFLTKRL